MAVFLVHGPADVLALNIGRCPHAAQRKENGDECFNKRAQLGAADRIIVEDSEDHCRDSLANCGRVSESTSTKRLTRNRQRLTAHDEDNLHRAELLETHLATRPDREPKLDTEDSTEHADADNGHDVRSALCPVEALAALWCPKDALSQIGGILAVADHQVEAEADSEHCNDTAECENTETPQLRHGRGADDMDLRDQSQLDEDKDQGSHDTVRNGDPYVLAQARGAILLHREKDKVQERTSHFGALDGAADDIAGESKYVEDPRQTAAFGSLSHKQ